MVPYHLFATSSGDLSSSPDPLVVRLDGGGGGLLVNLLTSLKIFWVSPTLLVFSICTTQFFTHCLCVVFKGGFFYLSLNLSDLPFVSSFLVYVDTFLE